MFLYYLGEVWSTFDKIFPLLTIVLKKWNDIRDIREQGEHTKTLLTSNA